MSSDNKKANVDEIMEKIREEINKQNNYYKDSDIFLSKNKPQYQSPFVFLELQRLNLPELKINESCKDDSNHTYHINDFLRCNTNEFIQKAFNVIYAAEPDQAGTDALIKRLKKGMTRTYILGRMRYSSIGRKVGSRIKNLTFPFLVNSFFRVPLFGYILSVIIKFMKLPKALADISLNLMELSSNHMALTNHINKVSGLINNHLNEILNKLEVEMNHIISFRENDSDRLRNFLIFIKKELSKLNNQINYLKPEKDKSDQPLISDEMYFEFEEQFRGTREEIKERQKMYLGLVKSVEAGKSDSMILDIGCGRGEWLELCNAEQLEAVGVDTNDIMVSRCRGFGLNAIKVDALEYLKSHKNSSIGAVTGFHFIEHIAFPELISILNEAFRVLKPNGLLILETPNPENLIVGACSFYYDPTHFKPIPPRLLEYMLKACGFKNIEVKRINIKDDFVNLFTSSVDKEFFNLFAGAQDYSILGYKIQKFE